jgi:class 3 adenylate cyclase
MSGCRYCLAAQACVVRLWEGTLSEERVERRLAAILAADVVGYSRLMGADEGTLAALKAIRRELLDPRIVEHRGRIVKSTGDDPCADKGRAALTAWASPTG